MKLGWHRVLSVGHLRIAVTVRELPHCSQGNCFHSIINRVSNPLLFQSLKIAAFGNTMKKILFKKSLKKVGYCHNLPRARTATCSVVRLYTSNREIDQNHVN
jgi:hypothetical protein